MAPTAETILKKTNETLAGNACLYDAYGRPITSDPATQALKVYVVNGGGSVTWPLQFGAAIAAHPAPTGSWQLYAYTDGVKEYAYLMTPLGATIYLGEEV